MHNCSIVSWKWFRKARTSPYCRCRWSTSSTFIQVLQEKLPFQMILKLLNELFVFQCGSCPVVGHCSEKTRIAYLFLRLLLPGINPHLVIEYIPLTFLMWLMYSMQSSGDSTLSCNAGSTRVSPECPWVALKYRQYLEEWGFRQCWNFFFGPPPFARKVIQASTIELCVEFFDNVINRTAPSSSPGFDRSCRSNLIMAFDTTTIFTDFSGLRMGIETGNNVTADFSCGLALATGFPVTLCSTLSREMVSKVSVAYCSNPRIVSVSKQRFDHDFSTATPLMKADLHIQHRADFRVSENPHFQSECFFTSRQRVLSTSILQFTGSFMKCNLSFFNNLQTGSRVWTIFWSWRCCSNLCSWSCGRFLYNSALVWARSSAGSSIDSKSSFAAGFLATLNLWIILCTNLLLLPRYWAD